MQGPIARLSGRPPAGSRQTGRYEYVRFGAATVLLSVLGAPHQGPFPSTMLSQQAALQTAQGA